jgi:surfeit locus 1 family protein
MRLMRLLPSIAAVAVIVLTASLGHWQTGRARDKAMAAQAREAALARAPIEITAAASATELDGARIALRGRWAAEHTIFLDNRTRKGVAGFHVVTPFRLEGVQDMHVLVLRGWIARDVADRTRLPRVTTPEGPVLIEGLGMATFPQPIRLSNNADVDPNTPRIWQHLQTDRFERWSGRVTHSLMVRQSSETEDGLMRDWTLPGSGEDKHRAYAFQWFAMSAVTAAIWIGLLLRRRLQSR